jgi:hypothetical protein
MNGAEERPGDVNPIVNSFVPGISVGPTLGATLGAVLGAWLGAVDVPPPQAATRIVAPKINANARWIDCRRIVSDSQLLPRIRDP